LACVRGALIRLDLLLAVALTVAGEAELLFGPGDLVSAIALPLTTLPLVWRRRAPLLPLAAIALVLPLQALLDGKLVGDEFTPLVALVVALYSAGRHTAGARPLAAALALVATLVATRVAFDPSVATVADALVTLVYVPLPLLVGRWVRGQALLQQELREKTEELERERVRNARHAAEEERMRIANDLQVAVTGALATIVREAGEVAGGAAGARSLLADCAERAREALADVRRILGVLRRDGSRPPRGPEFDAPEGARDDTWAAALDDDARGAAIDDGARVPARDDVSPVVAPAVLDRLLVAALFTGAAIELAILDGGALAIATAVPIVAPLLWRRTRPVEVALAVLAAVALQSVLLGLDRFPLFDMGAITCAAYALGAHAGRDRAIAGFALLAAGSAVHAAVFHPDAIPAALLGGALAPWAAGRTVRARRLLTAELREKTLRLSRARAREAQAAALDERMRVARELHDAVAHSLSVIAIQAAGAVGIADRDPARTAEAAALIASVGGDALTELDRLVSPAGAAAADPSLARVDRLAERARDAGLPVELHVEGEPAALPTGVDLAAYRIVQEALANTSKHAGDARARVFVRYEPRAVEVEVADDGRGANGGTGGDGTGHGLVGIRERVALYGGTLDMGGRSGGGFRVRARLPIGRA
jgi:signal transduction histidine kinase